MTRLEFASLQFLYTIRHKTNMHIGISFIFITTKFTLAVLLSHGLYCFNNIKDLVAFNYIL